MPTRPPVHQPHDRNVEYDSRRGTPYQRGYTKRWDSMARAYRRMHPLCVGCAAVGRTTLAQCVDHVVPHKGDYLLMWSPSNLQALCHWHHNHIKQQLEYLHSMGLVELCDLRMDSDKAIALTKQKSLR